MPTLTSCRWGHLGKPHPLRGVGLGDQKGPLTSTSIRLSSTGTCETGRGADRVPEKKFPKRGRSLPESSRGRLQWRRTRACTTTPQRASHGIPGRRLGHALDRRPEGRRRLRRPAPLGALLPPPRPPRPRPAPLGAPGRGDRGRGGRGLERLRQLLPRRRRTAASPSSPTATTSGGCWSSSPSARSSASSNARRRRSAAAAGWSASRP